MQALVYKVKNTMYTSQRSLKKNGKLIEQSYLFVCILHVPGVICSWWMGGCDVHMYVWYVHDFYVIYIYMGPVCICGVCTWYVYDVYMGPVCVCVIYKWYVCHVYVGPVYMCVPTPQHRCGGQGSTCQGQLSPPTM